jgi:hypothetical protein
MGEFFWGWRRKVGLMTLLMACVFAAGWVRSFYVRDTIIIYGRFPVLSVSSKDGQLSWEKQLPFVLKGPFNPVQDLNDGAQNYWEPWDIHWRWRREWYGFLFGSGVLSLSLDKFPPNERRWMSEPPQKRRVEVWMIPYWSIVIPLTLLSAFLLLSTPHQSTPKKTAEVNHEKVV